MAKSRASGTFSAAGKAAWKAKAEWLRSSEKWGKTQDESRLRDITQIAPGDYVFMGAQKGEIVSIKPKTIRIKNEQGEILSVSKDFYRAHFPKDSIQKIKDAHEKTQLLYKKYSELLDKVKNSKELVKILGMMR